MIVERGTSDFLDLDHRYREHENSQKIMNHVLRISKGRTVEPYLRIGKMVLIVTVFALIL